VVCPNDEPLWKVDCRDWAYVPGAAPRHPSLHRCSLAFLGQTADAGRRASVSAMDLGAGAKGLRGLLDVNAVMARCEGHPPAWLLAENTRRSARPRSGASPLRAPTLARKLDEDDGRTEAEADEPRELPEQLQHEDNIVTCLLTRTIVTSDDSSYY